MKRTNTRLIHTHGMAKPAPRLFTRCHQVVSRPLSVMLGDEDMSWIGGECDSRLSIRAGVRQVLSISNRSRRRYLLTCLRAGVSGQHLLDGTDVHMQLSQVWGEVQVDTQGIRMLDLEPGATITLVFRLDGDKRARWQLSAREETGAPVLMPFWVV